MITEAMDLRYTLEEFYALPEGTRAELISGVIYDMSPAPLRIHQEISMVMSSFIHQYIKRNKGACRVYSAPFDVQLSEDTVVQPDISVICDSDKLTERGCSGAPDFVIEITSSNEVHDYLIKLDLYRKFGVREYWIVNPKTEVTTVYFFGEEEAVNSHKFTDNITVGIYKNNPEPLQINIAELLG